MARKKAIEKTSTGAELIDGLPFFAEYKGKRMNRPQWLKASQEERRKKVVDDLDEFVTADQSEPDIFDEHGTEE